MQELSKQSGGLQGQIGDLSGTIGTLQGQIASNQQATQQQISGVEQSLNDKLEAQAAGQAVALSDAEANLLAQITGGDAAILKELSAQTGGLQGQIGDLGGTINTVQQQIASNQEATGQRFDTLEGQISEDRAATLSAITGLSTEFLQGLSGLEASMLENQTGLRNDLTAFQDLNKEQLAGVQNSLYEKINQQNDQFIERDEATNQNIVDLGNVLTGQIGGVQGNLDVLGNELTGQISGVQGNLDTLGSDLTGQISGVQGNVDELGNELGGQIAGVAGNLAGLGGAVGQGFDAVGQSFAGIGAGLLGLDQRINAANAKSTFNPQWQGLYDYTTLTPYQQRQAQQYIDYTQRRGMLS